MVSKSDEEMAAEIKSLFVRTEKKDRPVGDYPYFYFAFQPPGLKNEFGFCVNMYTLMDNLMIVPPNLSGECVAIKTNEFFPHATIALLDARAVCKCSNDALTFLTPPVSHLPLDKQLTIFKHAFSACDREPSETAIARLFGEQFSLDDLYKNEDES